MADDINYDRPTLSELIARTRGDMAGKVTNSLAYIRGSLEWGISAALAGAVSLTYGAIDQLYRNILADRSTATWLDRKASEFNLVRQVATTSGGIVTFTWTAGGQTIPAGTVLTDAAGNEYTTFWITADPGGPLYPDDGTAAVFSSYTGLAANIATGTELTITTPIAGITSVGVAAADFINGSDLETDDDFRERTLDRIRNTPQGGADADYEVWAKSVADVNEVWVVTAVEELPQFFVIYNGSAAAVTVQAAIDAAKPIQAQPTVGSVDSDPTYQFSVSLDITAHALAGYADGDVEDNIEAAISELFDQQGGPSITIYNSALRNAISNAEGLDYYTLDDVNSDGTGLDDLASGVTTVHYLTAVAYTWIP